MPSLSLSDLDELMTRGGVGRVKLLQFCVRSVTMEPLFVYLVSEYRWRPTHVAALALYDVFCAPGALARVKALAALPPRELRLSAAVAPLRRQFDYLRSPPADDDSGMSITTPYRNMYDNVVSALRDDPDGPLAEVVRRYDPDLDPTENLPGGRMNAGQRHFVDNIWKPLIRPQLVGAGFWQVGSIE